MSASPLRVVSSPRAPGGVLFFCFFFFNDTATTEIYTLSLHDALPIYRVGAWGLHRFKSRLFWHVKTLDRKSTRLNSSHGSISYAVFCLNKKQTTQAIHLQYRTRQELLKLQPHPRH